MSHHGGRVLVHLAESLTKPAKLAHFTQCLVKSLKLDSEGESGFVTCTLRHDLFSSRTNFANLNPRDLFVCIKGVLEQIVMM